MNALFFSLLIITQPNAEFLGKDSRLIHDGVTHTWESQSGMNYYDVNSGSWKARSDTLVLDSTEGLYQAVASDSQFVIDENEIHITAMEWHSAPTKFEMMFQDVGTLHSDEDTLAFEYLPVQATFDISIDEVNGNQVVAYDIIPGLNWAALKSPEGFKSFTEFSSRNILPDPAEFGSVSSDSIYVAVRYKVLDWTGYDINIGGLTIADGDIWYGSRADFSDQSDLMAQMLPGYTYRGHIYNTDSCTPEPISTEFIGDEFEHPTTYILDRVDNYIYVLTEWEYLGEESFVVDPTWTDQSQGTTSRSARCYNYEATWTRDNEPWMFSPGKHVSTVSRIYAYAHKLDLSDIPNDKVISSVAVTYYDGGTWLNPGNVDTQRLSTVDPAYDQNLTGITTSIDYDHYTNNSSDTANWSYYDGSNWSCSSVWTEYVFPSSHVENSKTLSQTTQADLVFNLTAPQISDFQDAYDDHDSVILLLDGKLTSGAIDTLCYIGGPGNSTLAYRPYISVTYSDPPTPTPTPTAILPTPPVMQYYDEFSEAWNNLTEGASNTATENYGGDGQVNVRADFQTTNASVSSYDLDYQDNDGTWNSQVSATASDPYVWSSGEFTNRDFRVCENLTRGDSSDYSVDAGKYSLVIQTVTPTPVPVPTHIWVMDDIDGTTATVDVDVRLSGYGEVYPQWIPSGSDLLYHVEIKSSSEFYLIGSTTDTAYAAEDLPSATYEFRVRAQDTPGTYSQYVNSATIALTVNTPLPTNTPTETPTPSNTPTPTATPTPVFGEPTVYETGSYPRAITVGDFDGDGDQDIAVANQFDRSISLFANLIYGITYGVTDVQPGQLYEYPNSPMVTGEEYWSLSTGDVDQDSYIDLVGMNDGPEPVSILYGNGDGTFAAPIHFGQGTGPRAAEVVELCTDGYADIVIIDSASNELHVRLNLAGQGQ